MEIRRRVGLARTTLHGMNRGSRKVAICADDKDREMFVDIFGRFSLKYGIVQRSWALMPNHYHMEPESTGDRLWRMVRDFESRYARAFNQRHGTSARLFQGVFKTTWIGDDPRGLAYVSRYIHLNAAQLGIRPEDYRWSSCRSYLGLEQTPKWLDPTPVLDAVSTPGRSPRQCYRDYLREAPKKRRRAEMASEDVGDFHLEYLRHIEERCIERLTPVKDDLGRLSMRTIVSWAAVSVYRISPKIVSEFFGYESADSVSAATSRFRSKVQEDPRLAAALNRIQSIRPPKC